MNADLESLQCPVCGTAMQPDKEFHGLFRRTVRYRRTCGHYEDHDRVPSRSGVESQDPDTLCGPLARVDAALKAGLAYHPG